jgi:hypothetical protein
MFAFPTVLYSFDARASLLAHVSQLRCAAMPTDLPSPSNPSAFASIAATLEVDPLSSDILRFLLKNETAMDSAKGIAAWWVQRDELAVRPSLDRLFACGAIVAHTLSTGITVYGLSQNPDVRIWLRNALAGPHGERTSTQRPLIQKQSGHRRVG